MNRCVASQPMPLSTGGEEIPWLEKKKKKTSMELLKERNEDTRESKFEKEQQHGGYFVHECVCVRIEVGLRVA